MCDTPPYEPIPRASSEAGNAAPTRRSRRFLEGLMRTLDVPAFVKDEESRWIMLNDTMCQMIGAPKDALIGKRDEEILPEADARTLREMDEAVLAAGEPVTVERRLNVGGGRRTVQVREALLADEATGERLIIGTLRDMTRQRSLEESRRRYELLVNTSRDFMTLIDRRYEYVAANDAYCEAHGKHREEIIGNTVAEVWGDSLFEGLIRDYLDQCFAGHEVRYEAWFSFRGSGPRFYHVVYTPYVSEAGEVTHVVVVSRDITDRYLAESALKRESAINTAIADLSEAILSSSSLADVGRLVLRYAASLTGSELGMAASLDPDTGQCRAVVGSPAPGDDIDPEPFDLKPSGPAWKTMIEPAGPILSNTPDGDPRMPGVTGRRGEIRRFLSMPALREDVSEAPIGRLVVANADRPYTTTDRELLQRLAVLYAIAISHRRMERERINKEKLEGILEMAGAVCHELNQPLQILSGYTELLIRALPADNPLRQRAGDVLKEVDRIGILTKKLMGITRYETKSYSGNRRIIDIDKSSSRMVR